MHSRPYKKTKFLIQSDEFKYKLKGYNKFNLRSEKNMLLILDVR